MVTKFVFLYKWDPFLINFYSKKSAGLFPFYKIALEHLREFALCWWGLEYADYPLQRDKPPAQVFMCSTLNCILWWSSSSEDLVSVEHSFIAITPKSTLTCNGSTG